MTDSTVSKTETIALKPCPECGSDNLGIMTEYTSGNRVIHCTGCHKYYDKLELTREDTPSDIFERWNEYAQNYKPEPKTEPTLKPCPFCGEESPYYVCDDTGEYILCPNCLNELRSQVVIGKDALVKDWNRRANND